MTKKPPLPAGVGGARQGLHLMRSLAISIRLIDIVMRFCAQLASWERIILLLHK